MDTSTSNLLICLVWLFICGVSHTQFTSNPTPICRLYDLDTGVDVTDTNTFEVFAKETDGELYPYQEIRVGIHGQGSAVFEERDSDVWTQYGINFAYIPANSVSPNSGYMVIGISQELDRDGLTWSNQDDLDVLQFNMACTGTGESFFGVTIRIADSNDNAPVFASSSYSVSIEEALPPYSVLFNDIAATDKDARRNKDIIFNIESGNTYLGDTYFTIDPSDGFIMLSNSLDYESLYENSATEFSVYVTARDNASDASQRHTSTVTLTVIITDSDDLTPTFYHSGCRTNVHLDPACDAVVYKGSVDSGLVAANPLQVVPIVTGDENTPASIRAFDLDRLNSPITFSILGSTPFGLQSRFGIQTNGPSTDATLPGRDIYTASIQQLSSVDSGIHKEFSLFIKAEQTDRPDMYTTAEIKFTTEGASTVTTDATDTTVVETTCPQSNTNAGVLTTTLVNHNMLIGTTLCTWTLFKLV